MSATRWRTARAPSCTKLVVRRRRHPPWVEQRRPRPRRALELAEEQVGRHPRGGDAPLLEAGGHPAAVGAGGDPADEGHVVRRDEVVGHPAVGGGAGAQGVGGVARPGRPSDHRRSDRPGSADDVAGAADDDAGPAADGRRTQRAGRLVEGDVGALERRAGAARRWRRSAGPRSGSRAAPGRGSGRGWRSRRGRRARWCRRRAGPPRRRRPRDTPVTARARPPCPRAGAAARPAHRAPGSRCAWPSRRTAPRMSNGSSVSSVQVDRAARRSTPRRGARRTPRRRGARWRARGRARR